GLSRVQAEEAAADSINSILRGNGSVPIMQEFVGEASAFRDRRLLIADSEIEDFLDNDLKSVLTKFDTSVTPQVEMARKFRTGSPGLDALPARLDNAIATAQRTGDNTQLLDIIDDASNFRASAALAAQLTEEGATKAALVERTMEQLPAMRVAARESAKRHAGERGKVDQYTSALKRRDAIEAELRGSRFDSLPQTVQREFAQELEAQHLRGQQRTLDNAIAAEAAARKASSKAQARARRSKNPEFKTFARNAKARVAEAQKRVTAAEKSLSVRRKELLTSDSTRGKFFRAWKRWVMGQDEKVFPATRKALSKFAKGGGRGLATVGNDYVQVVGRIVKQRNNIARVRQRAAELALEKDARGADLGQAESTLKGLRVDAQKTDSGIMLARPKAVRTQDLIAAAENAVANARRRDAMRAVNLEHIEAAMIRDASRLKDKTPARSKQIEKELESDLADLRIVRDRLLNRNLMAGREPTSWALSANRLVRRFNYMRAMGGVTLSSLPDVAMHSFVNGLGTTMGNFRTSMRLGLKGLKDKDELARLAYSLEVVMGSRVKSFGDIENLLTTGRIEKFVDKASEKFTFLTLINSWNGINKAVAALGAQDRLLKDISQLVAGKGLTKGQRRNLAAAGINKDVAKGIDDQRKIWSELEEGQILSRSDQWTDPVAKRIFSEAVFSDVRRTIVTPSAGDLPRWMSTATGSLIGQFKSFAMSSTTKVMLSGLQRRDAAVILGTMEMMALGGAVFALKELAKGRDPFEKSPNEWAFNAIDRSGIFGIVMDGSNILDRSMSAGAGSMLGVGSSTRATARTAMEQLFGPTFGTAFDSIQTLQALRGGQLTESDIRRVRRLAPFNNIFYLQALFNQLEKKAADVIVGSGE
ncbi:MAG: hypothetical protein V3T77_11270, partial [Planctomycetota bacterium]